MTGPRCQDVFRWQQPHSRRLRRALGAVLTALVTFVIAPSSVIAGTALEDARAKAIAWLITNQHADGSWKTVAGNEAAATTTAVDALATAGVKSFPYANGVSWIGNATIASVDSLSRIITSLTGAGVDAAAHGDRLVGLRNAKLTWGAYGQYDTSFPDTPLALGAIVTSRPGYTDQELQTALCAIVNARRTLAGVPGVSWSYLPPTGAPASTIASAIVPTAQNILVMNAIGTAKNWLTVTLPCSSTTLSTAVNSGADWLLSTQKSDGGFSTDAASTVLETALVYQALSVVRPAAAGTAIPGVSATSKALDFLIANQSGDGSWGGDAFVTAMVSKTFGPPTTALVDSDNDGVPDVVEALIGTNAGLSDSRFLAHGNGRYVITSLSPASVMAAAAAFSLTVNGDNFGPSSTVQWNGRSRTTTFVSAGQLRASVSATDVATARANAVTVFTPAPGGGSTAAVAFLVNNPAPSAASLSPAAMVAGAASFTLTVTGANFVPASTVQWNGVGKSTAFVSSTQITATITVSDVATAGTASITVFSPGPGGGTTAALTFTVNNPLPVVGALMPASAIVGTPGLTVTVTGSNFVRTSVVQWNGVARATTFVSTTQLQASLVPGDLAAATTTSVSVFNPSPGGGVSAAQTFTINNPGPTLTSLSPTSATAAGAAFTLTVTGADFVSGSAVQWNGTARTTTFVSATQLQASISTSDIAVGGTASVVVSTPAPGGGVTAAQTFTINNPGPTLTSLSPASATAGGAAFALTVTGTNFVSGSAVQWNGSSRTTTFVSATQLQISVSAADVGASGSAAVAVFNPTPGGGLSPSMTFTISTNTGNPPTLTSIAPTSIRAGSAPFTLTVTGANFVDSSVVRWNGSDRPTTVISATQLRAAIPAADVGAAATATVTVFNPAPAGGASGPLSFTISTNTGNPVPVLISGTPLLVQAGSSDFTITASGLSFVAASVLRWNGADRPTTVLSTQELQATVPASDIAAAGTASLTVFSPAPGGGTSNALSVSVVLAVPVATSLTPASVFAAGPAFTLTVTGSRFVSSSIVRWNGANRTTTYVNGTQLQAAIPASDIVATGTSLVTVNTPGAGSSAALTLTIAVNPWPQLTSLSPNTIGAGSPAFTLAVSGSNFVPDSTVQWNGQTRTTTFVSSTQLQAAILASDIATAGTAAVTVFSPAPGGGTSNIASFQIFSGWLFSLTPPSAPAGGGSFTLTITGSGFTPSSFVWWNGPCGTAFRATTFVSPTQLTAVIPASDLCAIGTASVSVYVPGGASNVLPFTIMPVPDVIIDNGAAGTSFTGSWTPSPAPSPYGTDSLVSPGTGSATYRWTPTIPFTGTYQVFIWWPSDNTLSATVPVRLAAADGVHSFIANQQAGGGVWQSIGAFTFNAGTSGYVEVSDVNGRAAADAVRFAPTATGTIATLTVSQGQGSGSGVVTSSPAGIQCSPDCSETYLTGTAVTLTPTPAVGSTFAGWTGDPDCLDGVVTMTANRQCIATFSGNELVIDDGQPGTTFSGQWSVSPAANAYGGGSLVAAGSTGATYRWTPTIPMMWQYQVFVWWPVDAGLSVNVPLTIAQMDAFSGFPFQSMAFVNQQTGGGQWFLLGTFTFGTGTSSYVEISDANGRTAADAVRFVPFGPPPRPPWWDPCAGGCGGGL